MKQSILLSLLLTSLLLTGCSPKVIAPAPGLMDGLMTQSTEQRQKILEDELRAMTRKAEILERLHGYSPFVRMIPVFLPGKQLPSGGYTHPQVVSVPLIYKQSSLRVSSEVAEGMLKKSVVPESAASAAPQLPMPLTPNTSTPAVTPGMGQ